MCHTSVAPSLGRTVIGASHFRPLSSTVIGSPFASLYSRSAMWRTVASFSDSGVSVRNFDGDDGGVGTRERSRHVEFHDVCAVRRSGALPFG